MTLTDKQFEALAPYADEFRRAIESNYCKSPRRDELEQIRQILVDATGSKHYPSNYGCTACVISLMKDAGRLYFETCDARALAAAEREEERKAADAPKEPEILTSGETPAPKPATTNKTKKTAKK